MSFFGKFKSGAASTTGSTTTNNGVKKDQNAKPTALDKHLVDYSDPIRPDGSDKFFGFENYGSTCYANSVIQCLYYSEPFRESVLGFPSSAFLKDWQEKGSQLPEKLENGTLNGTPLPARLASTSVTTPYPNPTSPARKPPGVTTPASPARAEDNKDSPEYKKRMAIQMGPVLDMTQDRSKEYAMEESLFTSLKDIFAAIIANQSRTGVVSPHKFLEILRRENEMFRSAMHQDAHEFLNLLLNSVVENVEHFTKEQKEALANGTANAAPAELAPDPRWVNDIFEGTLTSETRCLTCETVSQRDEPFLDLSVDLSPFTSVTSCLKKFSQEEMLCERNKFHCDNCGGLQEAEKRMKIKSLPRVLALHLKRFKYTEDLRQLQKLFHKVVYPFHLRLFNTTDDAGDSDRLYELYAVVVHIGGGPYHGHYVSIVKTQDRGWLLFDDELVEPVDKNYVLNFFGGEPVPGVQDARQLACAYVLFYQETTLEAVLKDQAAEQAASRPASEAVATSPVTDGYKTPGLGEIEQVSPVTPQPLVVPMSPAALGPDIVRSKKELKAEEKDRKAAEKMDAADKREKEAAEKRTEVLRRQEEQHKRSLAHANISKATTTTTTTTEVETPTSPVVVEKSGFGRFMRPSSMTLKNRPKMPFMGGGNNDAKDQQEDTLSPMGGLPHGAVANESDLQAGPAVQLPTVDELVRQHKEKRNRFGLGKKKSTHFFS